MATTVPEPLLAIALALVTQVDEVVEKMPPYQQAAAEIGLTTFLTWL